MRLRAAQRRAAAIAEARDADSSALAPRLPLDPVQYRTQFIPPPRGAAARGGTRNQRQRAWDPARGLALERVRRDGDAAQTSELVAQLRLAAAQAEELHVGSGVGEEVGRASGGGKRE